MFIQCGCFHSLNLGQWRMHRINCVSHMRVFLLNAMGFDSMENPFNENHIQILWLSIFLSFFQSCWSVDSFLHFISLFLCVTYIFDGLDACVCPPKWHSLSFVRSFIRCFFIYIRLPTCPSLTNATTYGACFYSGSTYPLHHKTKLITSQPSEA